MAGRILVLDDEENYAEMLQDLLRDHDYRVDMATRPERAIEQIEEIAYDLVISDYKMPVMDGADFLKRARELYPNLPFILVSGLMNTPELVKVANMGVTLVMEKPLDTQSFLEYVARFSTSMTAEEKEALETEAKGSAVEESGRHVNYPSEPRYFSANSPVSSRFLDQIWELCEANSYTFIYDAQGGDAELAVKDLSLWLGNSDKPLTALSFEELIDGGRAGVDAILRQRDSSSVIVIRLDSMEQISAASDFVSKELEGLDDLGRLLLAFVFRGDVPPHEFLAAAGNCSVQVPPMVERPSDIAEYAKRALARASKQKEKPNCSEFTAEAIYALLAYSWPRNFREIVEVISHAVSASENTALGLPQLRDAMKGAVEHVPVSEDRLRSLLKVAQTHYLEAELGRTGLSPSELGKELELKQPVQDRDQLLQTPLLQPGLAEL